MDALTDKNFRKELIARYLDAETDAAEEKLLAEYFAGHRPEADEEAVARLILAERPEALLAGGEQEFDREAERGQGGSAARPWRWALAGLAAAAALALFLLRPTTPPAPAFTPLEIAESLSTIADLGLGDIESVTAVPSGANFLVTVHIKDGSDLTFIMSKDGDTGTLSLASTE